MRLDTVVRLAEESRHEPRPYLIRRECWMDVLFYSLGNTELYAETFGAAEELKSASFCIEDILANDWCAVLPSDEAPGWIKRPPTLPE